MSASGDGFQPSTAQEGFVLAEGETLALALFFDWASALEAVLLFFQLLALPVELILHLAMSGVEFVFALLELAFLLGNLLLEDHLHLGFHL